MKKDNKYFQTQDLNLSAVLLSKNFTLINTFKNVDGKSTFCFCIDKGLDDVIQQYWNNTLLINPQSLFNSLKTLKNRIYSNY